MAKRRTGCLSRRPAEKCLGGLVGVCAGGVALFGKFSSRRRFGSFQFPVCKHCSGFAGISGNGPQHHQLGRSPDNANHSFQKGAGGGCGQNHPRRFEFRRRVQQRSSLRLAARRRETLPRPQPQPGFDGRSSRCFFRAHGAGLFPDLHEHPPAFQHRCRQMPGAGGHQLL